MVRPDMPDLLSHYYECAHGPFRNLSDLGDDDAEAVLATLRQRGRTFAAQSAPDYLDTRRKLEATVRARFVERGGRPIRLHPHYMLLGECEWVRSWFEAGCILQIRLDVFDWRQVSFTYGDIFPAMRFGDGKPYRQQVYLLHELPALIAQFGLPQQQNPEGLHGPDRYIEAQVWDDTPLEAFIQPAPSATT